MKQTITKAIITGLLSVVAIANFSFAGAAGTFVDDQQAGGIKVAGGQTNLTKSDNLITTIKTFVNLALTFLGLIALIVLLYGGFNMVTAAGDEGKYKEGFKIMRQAGIGLIFIGLAALFVQLIFWIIGSIA